MFSVSLFAVSSALIYAGDITHDILTNSAASVNISDRLTVIIDAGHGGVDGGASGLNGTLEKELNLEVAMLLGTLLEATGYNVVYTRTDDSMLGDGSSGHRKLADLQYRLDLSKKYENAVFVSIHMNKFPVQSCRGMQLYYSGNNTGGAELAQFIRDLNKKVLQPDNNREIKKATSAIYILNRIEVPAVLVECGFVSNSEESLLLQDEEYQHKLAAVIAGAMLEYLASDT